MIQECAHCSKPVRTDSMTSHLLICPLIKASCLHSKNGCIWYGNNCELQLHLTTCPYEAVKGFINQSNQRLSLLEMENRELKLKLGNMEECVLNLTRDVSVIKSHVIMTDEMSNMVVPSLIVDSMGHDVQMLKVELEQLKIQLARAETRLIEKTTTDSSQMNQEIQALRSICQTVQIQMFNLVLRGNNNSSPPIASSSNSSQRKGNTKL
jgi:regulator of replication initiation timing